MIIHDPMALWTFQVSLLFTYKVIFIKATEIPLIFFYSATDFVNSSLHFPCSLMKACIMASREDDVEG